MCISDLRFGGNIRHVRKSSTLGAAGTLTVPANPQRIGILFAISIYASVTANVGQISVTGGDFVATIGAGNNNVEFDIRRHGDLVIQGFTLTNGGTGGNVCTITEFIASEAELAAAVDEFKRKF